MPDQLLFGTNRRGGFETRTICWITRYGLGWLLDAALQAYEKERYWAQQRCISGKQGRTVSEATVQTIGRKPEDSDAAAPCGSSLVIYQSPAKTQQINALCTVSPQFIHRGLHHISRSVLERELQVSCDLSTRSDGPHLNRSSGVTAHPFATENKRRRVSGRVHHAFLRMRTQKKGLGV